MNLVRTSLLALFGLLLLAACRPEPALAPATPTAIRVALTPSAPAPADTLSAPAPTLPAELAPSASPTPALTSAAAPAGTPELAAAAGPWANYPAPTTTPPTPIPPPAEPLRLPPDIDVFLLLGTDITGTERGRTDSIILVFLNRETNDVSLVSIPRDLLVYQPGRTMERINTAYVHGGFDLLALTMEYNLGVRPSHWALAHLNDFVSFVDDLGGIDVPVSDALPNDCDGIPGGIFHMSGRVALCYVRERQTTGDFARSRRQQEVLFVILQRVLSLDSLGKVPEWYQRYRGAIQSNFTVEELLKLAPAAVHVHSAGLNSFQITLNETSFWNNPINGASVLLPDRAKITAVLQQAVAALDHSGVDASLEQAP